MRLVLYQCPHSIAPISILLTAMFSSPSAFWSLELRLSLERGLKQETRLKPRFQLFIQTSLNGFSRRHDPVRQCRDSQRILHGKPESPVSPQSTFPGREITVRIGQ